MIEVYNISNCYVHQTKFFFLLLLFTPSDFISKTFTGFLSDCFQHLLLHCQLSEKCFPVVFLEQFDQKLFVICYVLVLHTRRRKSLFFLESSFLIVANFVSYRHNRNCSSKFDRKRFFKRSISSFLSDRKTKKKTFKVIFF